MKCLILHLFINQFVIARFVRLYDYITYVNVNALIGHMYRSDHITLDDNMV